MFSAFYVTFSALIIKEAVFVPVFTVCFRLDQHQNYHLKKANNWVNLTAGSTAGYPGRYARYDPAL